MATSNEWFDTAFASSPVMAILRGFSPEKTVELARKAWSIGIDCVEVPIQNAAAVEALEATVRAGAELGKSVGAGTVISVEHVRQAAASGAVFTVSPGFDPEVARASLDAGLPHLPGIATASEIQAALKLDLGWVKAFPASDLGSGWFTALHGPFPGVRFVATGGINAHNTAEFLNAGADVVSLGSALEDPAQLDLLAGVLAGRAEAVRE